jgi:hypothetical protein
LVEQLVSIQVKTYKRLKGAHPVELEQASLWAR